MSRIDADPKTVRQLLDEAKYSIEFYQREYKWQTENIAELLEDLEDKFMLSYSPTHTREDGVTYDHYFLGSIIISQRNAERFIIDGQQRLTSLTLLLIYLNHLYLNHLEKHPKDIIDSLPQLILSTHRGTHSYNLNIDERKAVMDALYAGEQYDANGQPESVRNIVLRYQDIERLFPESLKEDALLFFIDWLLYNVDLVEITAYSDDDAYMIFETMNDRGISLTPTEMLKGYLLSNIQGVKEREAATKLWRHRIELLATPGEGKEEDANFFKSWLRARYANTIRSREANALNEDFEKIHNAFNKWVYDKHEELDLRRPEDFRDFVEVLFPRYSDHYLQIRRAARTFTPEFEYIFYNAYCGFSLQSLLILAPVKPTDDMDTVARKMRLVSGYIDIYVARHMWNFRNYDYNRIYYGMFGLARDIRDKSVPELVDFLRKRVVDMKDMDFVPSAFGLNRVNNWRVRYMLARITRHIEEQCDLQSSFTAYVDRSARRPYEIEHIWADNYNAHRDEFEDRSQFGEYRNRIGGLVLLKRGDNQSYGAKPYEKKVELYDAQNLLARSLNEKCYSFNTAFRSYMASSALPFRHYEHFTKEALDERQELYRLICEQIWSPARFDLELQ
jgi:uncharacterized protein with ParB-like and HNH nuclease domain